MEAAIRFSQNSLPGQADQNFLKVDVAGRILQVYNIKEGRKGGLKNDLVYASDKLPLFRAFDWHPTEAALVAIGQTGGEASLVNLADPQQTPVSFAVRSQRSCNAVGLNTQNWIAIGLDKVRNDFCLNVWDVSQRSNGAGGRSYGKSSNEPLHKLAGGEPITSLRFFQDHPQLLAAGVKGQFIRLYDLREPTSSSALQFATRCVNNIAVDTQDENYFASCLPANTPTVSIWDRRMISRTNIAQVGFGSFVSQADQHPEVSMELKNVVRAEGQIWGLRFTKTHRGCLGVLSSTGQLKIVNFGVDVAAPSNDLPSSEANIVPWNKQQSQGVFIEDTQNFANAWNERPQVDEAKRIVSFDFTTQVGRNGQPKIITLTGDGKITLSSIAGRGAPLAISSLSSPHNENTAKSTLPGDLVRSQKLNEQKPALSSTALTRQRCEAGYLLNASENMGVCKDESLEVFWSWLKHAQTSAMDNVLVQSGIDLSYIGIFGVWMEEIDLKSRMARTSVFGNFHASTIISDLTRRLNLVRGRGCATEYPHNRALSLHLAGLPRSSEEIQRECDTFVANNEHTKAAAIALFAGETKIAQKALRSKGTGDSHKMLAMALMGSKNRRRRMPQNRYGSEKTHDADSESGDSQDDEWKDTISSVAEELQDCYARSILAYVKTSDWTDVVKERCLPLRYRVNIALRHFDDSKLTRYLSNLKSEVLSSGNLEGILITGLGTPESIELFKSYTGITNDIQTAALAMSFAAASDRFLPQNSIYARTVHCFRKTYKAQLMTLNLKYDKARFDVAVSRAIREAMLDTQPRQKEQIRVVCAHCNRSVSQFGHEQQVAEASPHITETQKHPLAPEKAAVQGVICPKCGRHLSRCGVCDMWLGTYDESFAKWYKPLPSSTRNSDNLGLSASMVGSTMTAIGSSSRTPVVSVTGTQGKTSVRSATKNLTTADLAPEVVEVVNEEVAQQEKERKWYEAMHKFTVFCTTCSHGFHAEHAKMWFDGYDGHGGHRTCPVPLCECLCNG